MKRKLMSVILLLLCTLLLPITAISATEDESVVAVDEGVFYFDKESGTVLDYWPNNGEAVTSLVIPEKLDGVSVTAIADYAFCNSEVLESITLPNGLKHIGQSAFSNCDALRSVKIPDSVTTIGIEAFDDCYVLESVTLGNGLTAIPDRMFAWCESLIDVTFGANITSIGESAFDSCTGLTKLTFPENLKTIGDNAFYACSWLSSITFGNNLESIGNFAFQNCDALTSITIPDSVTTIGESAFASCFSVSSIKIGKGLSSLGQRAFWCGNEQLSITVDAENKHFSADEHSVFFNKDKTELLFAPSAFKGAYTVPESVITIADNAFYFCDNLTAVTIGKNVKTIGNSAFNGCVGLTEVTIPDSVTHIGSNAFSNCIALERISIGKGLETLGESPFAYCDVLATMTVDPENKHFTADASGVLYSKDNAELIQAPTMFVGPYVVAEGTKAIAPCAFSNCSGLSAVTIPGSVHTIGAYAFNSCTKLTDLMIADGLQTIGSEAFFGCSELKNITLPDTIVSIGSSAFSCTAYRENKSNWDEKVLYIGNHLIESESPRSNLAIREGTISIAAYAFSYGNQTNITLPESLVGIGEAAFYCCDLQQVTIPKNVVHIGDMAFSECSYLSTIDVDKANKHFTSDESGVLYNKEQTVLLQIPSAFKGRYEITDTVTTIADGAIYGVPYLTRLTLPKSVTKIGNIYFDHGSNYSVYYTGSKTDWSKIDIHEYSIEYFDGTVIFNYVPVDRLDGKIPFSDVKQTDYFATPVLWASANKITSGMSAESFAPNAACTRAQVATFLWRAKGSPEPIYNDNPFRDVAEGDYYYKAVVWAYENNIIYGTSETTFSPNDPCTRGQVATLLLRCSYDEINYGAENPFTDISIEDYYYDGILWAYDHGITNGVSDSKFAPNAVCTRAQIVTFLFRALA